MTFKNYNIDNNEGENLSKVDRFALDLIAKKEEDRFCCLCDLFLNCSEDVKAIIEEEFYKNWNYLDAYTIRMTVEGGVFEYDEFIREAFIARIKKWNSENTIDVVIKDNPLICMIIMNMYSIIRRSEIIKIEKFACNSKMIKFITQPEKFNIDEFNDEWRFLFKCREYDELYKKMKQNKFRKEEEKAKIERRKKYFG